MSFLNINFDLLPIKMHYFFFDSANSPIIPFLSTITKQRGYSSTVFGSIFTLLLLLNIVVKPLTGYITDRWKCRRTVFLGSIILNGLVTPTLYLVPGATSSTGEISDAETFSSLQFWWFASVVILRMVLFMVTEVLQETICMKILDGDSVRFGRQRLWGAVGSGIMSIVAGVATDWYNSGKAQKDYLLGYLISATSFFIDFVVTFNLLKVPETDGQTTNILKDVKIVLKKAKVCVFLVWATIGGIFIVYIWYYFIWYLDDLATNYHPERKSMLSSIEGFSVTIQCFIGEVPFFYLSGHLIKRTGHMTAFSISFAIFAFRFLLYSFIRDPLWVLPVELLNGLTFGLSYIAGISYSAKIAPVGSEGTVQGLFSMAFQGFGASLGAILAGYTFSHLGSVMAFRFIGFSALVICVIQIVVNHFMNKNKKLIS
uniref:Major facilitator superfamily domain-containing protein 6-A n=1 Tax=Melanaphis sacchari TaxID=742174 RepID=A0A2H8TQW3_9HEMI